MNRAPQRTDLTYTLLCLLRYIDSTARDFMCPLGHRLGAQGGYVAKPLVGLWLLGPYLHNGSVPTLADLLAPAEQRPAVFYRGYDVVDLDRVGFMSTGGDAEAYGFRFDTAIRGNGNGGHLYGTQLSDTDKRALLEYLKKL
jgi:hypothetical protein